ncbi:MAG TPA: hypothetical protein PKD85_19225, partial [Saprospiraceae bacterium]|nr:hypothetical protein [Saprospiraceae bacterium]
PDSINQEFVNNQAVIGQDSVVVILTGATSKTLDGRGAHFHLIINGIVAPGGSATTVNGDIVKILPYALGTGVIGITGAGACTLIWREENTVVSNQLPFSYLTQPTAKIQNN